MTDEPTPFPELDPAQDVAVTVEDQVGVARSGPEQVLVRQPRPAPVAAVLHDDREAAVAAGRREMSSTTRG